MGWDNATTYAGEVTRPIRSYIRSIGIAFCLVLGVYILIAPYRGPYRRRS